MNNIISHIKCGSKEKPVKVTGSLFSGCLIGHPARHSAPQALGEALSLSRTSIRCRSPAVAVDRGQGEHLQAQLFTLTCILTTTGAEATADSSRTGTPPRARFLQDFDSGDRDSRARPAAPTLGSVSAPP